MENYLKEMAELMKKHLLEHQHKDHQKDHHSKDHHSKDHQAPHSVEKYRSVDERAESPIKHLIAITVVEALSFKNLFKII